MGAISEKLVYLNGTKQAIKQAINEDFEVIDDNTTFREYADEISSNNAKYKDLIPKETKNATNTLDISNSSGLDKALVTQYGNTYQETTTGKNLINLANGTYDNEIVATTQNGIITLNGTTTATRFIFIPLNTKLSLINEEKYTISTNNEIANGNVRFRIDDSGSYDTILNNVNSTKTITYSSDSTLYDNRIVIRIASGTTLDNFVIKPMLEKGSQATPYEEYTGGIPAPNPDYPQTITNVTGTNTIKIVGKNLFDLSNITTGKTFTNTGAISSLTNSFIQEIYIPVSSETDYTMSTTNDYSSETDYRLVICEYDSNKNFIKRNLGGSAVGNKYTITTSSTTKYVRLCASIVTLNELQFEENSTASDYEPYQEQSFDLDLPFELCKIGDYKDRIYPLNGKWYLEKKIGKAVLNDNDYSTFAINAVVSTFVQLLTPVIDNLFSTTTPTIDNQKLLSNYISNFGGVTANSRIRINILHQNLGTNSSSTNAEAKSAFVNKMTGKTLIFYYVLATPTTEEITESNYPTLYNQLNNIKLYEGVNHITMTNESGLDVEFDITYYKDWKLD